MYNGQTWQAGGSAQATTTQQGEVLLSTLAQLEAGTAPAGAYVPLANDVFTYGQSLVLAGANIAQTTVPGIANLATNAQAVAETMATIPGVMALSGTTFKLSGSICRSSGNRYYHSSSRYVYCFNGSRYGKFKCYRYSSDNNWWIIRCDHNSNRCRQLLFDCGWNTVGIANDAAVNVVTIGSTTASASLTLQSGSGGYSYCGQCGSNYYHRRNSSNRYNYPWFIISAPTNAVNVAGGNGVTTLTLAGGTGGNTVNIAGPRRRKPGYDRFNNWCSSAYFRLAQAILLYLVLMLLL